MKYCGVRNHHNFKKKTYPEKAEWSKSFIYSIIDVASKQSPEFRHVEIRSLNLFK